MKMLDIEAENNPLIRYSVNFFGLFSRSKSSIFQVPLKSFLKVYQHLTVILLYHNAKIQILLMIISLIFIAAKQRVSQTTLESEVLFGGDIFN